MSEDAPSSRRAVFVAAALATSMAFIDATALVVALPGIGRELGADAVQLLWVNAAYAIPLTALLLPGGALGDRYGCDRVFAWGVTVFAVAACGCGLAGSVPVLIGLRAVQGAGAALMIPGSLALITAAFPAHRRGRAIGAWTGLTVVATITGPVVGGVLAGQGLWRWIFFLNLPVSAVALLSLRAAPIPATGARGVRAPVDGTGALLATAALGTTSYGLLEASRAGLRNAVVVVSLGVGLLAALVFVRHLRRTEQPLVPMHLLGSRPLRVAALVTLLLYSAWNALLFFLPLNLIQVQGYTPLGAGLSLLPLMLALAALAWPAGRLVDRRGARLPLALGSLVAGGGFVLLAMPGLTDGAAAYATSFLPGLLLLGVGLGLTVPPLSATVMQAVPAEHMGLASGINSTLARLAGLVGTAVLGPLVLVSFLASFDAPGSEGVATAVFVAPIEPAARLAFVDSFRFLCLLSAALSWVGTGCVLLGLRRERGESLQRFEEGATSR